MTNQVVDCEAEEKEADADVELLGKMIEDHFPAEAACIDMTDRKSVMRLARRLLERLWRWEH